MAFLHTHTEEHKQSVRKTRKEKLNEDILKNGGDNSLAADQVRYWMWRAHEIMEELPMTPQDSAAVLASLTQSIGIANLWEELTGIKERLDRLENKREQG